MGADTVTDVITAALDAAHRRRPLQPHVQRLRAHHDASIVLDRMVHRAVDRAWSIGWQPRDLVRFARRTCSAGDGAVAAAVTAESSSYRDHERIDPRWVQQLDEIDAARVTGSRAHDLVALLQVLAWLSHLVPLPGAPEGRRGWQRPHGSATTAAHSAGSVDAVVAKVRALLAKAESTAYPAEAEAFSAKAQELITRHAIDRVLVDAAAGGAAPESRRVHLDDPYPEAKAQLLSCIASANRCQAVWSSGLGFCTIIGFSTDLDSVELLHASLLVQATRAVAVLGRDAPPGSRVRSVAFRRSFLVGFAAQIGERLRDAAAAQTQQATEQHGSSLVPVLAQRDDAVDNERNRLFPRLQPMTRRVSDHHGWAAGRAAGSTASMALDDEVAPHLAERSTRA